MMTLRRQSKSLSPVVQSDSSFFRSAGNVRAGLHGNEEMVEELADRGAVKMTSSSTRSIRAAMRSNACLYSSGR